MAELIAGWDYVGGGGGISMPVFPGEAGTSSKVFYALFFVLAIGSHMILRWLYSTPFGIALNAISDAADTAEPMGLHTMRYKLIDWAIAAFFRGFPGGWFGNMIGLTS